jgi:hypothetical protein
MLTGIPGNVSRNRLFRGWSEREALTVPVGERVGHPARLVTYDGRTRTIDDGARVTGACREARFTPAGPGLVRRGRPDRAAANQATSVLPVDTSNVACFDSLALVEVVEPRGSRGRIVPPSKRGDDGVFAAFGLCLAWAGRYR